MAAPSGSPISTPVSPPPSPGATDAATLERRGRRWVVISFLACPCHLPVTLAVLAAVLGGTAAGALLREHTLLAGGIVAVVWLLGTGRGLLLVRRAERTGLACPVPGPQRRRGLLGGVGLGAFRRG